MKNFLDRTSDFNKPSTNNFKFYVSASQELQVRIKLHLSNIFLKYCFTGVRMSNIYNFLSKMHFQCSRSKKL